MLFLRAKKSKPDFRVKVLKGEMFLITTRLENC